MVKKLNTNQRIQQDKPIEIWENKSAGWKWKVFKKYQRSAEAEAKNPYARWFCGVSSPMTYGQDELGDVYVHEIQTHAIQTFSEQ